MDYEPGPDPVPEVKARIGEFLRRWPAAEFGPAHIILSDYNLEDHWIDDCLARIAAGERGDSPPDELAATVAFLKELRAIPEDDRCDWYEDEDGEFPIT